MEEALAFDALLRLESPRYDIADVAQKAGKSSTFVAQRQRLVGLAPSIAEAFLADRIGVGHALEIAKLPAGQQEKAFDAVFRTVWNGGKESRVVLPLRDFTAWIEQNILLSLERVPFDKADPTLVPEAGSCAECPKRTGFNALLFGEMSQRDRCSDAVCFNNKLTRFVEKQIEEKPKLIQIATSYGVRGEGAVLPRNRYVALQLANPAKAKQPLSPYQKPCKHMAEAIVVEGAERGHTAKVCAEPSCTIHFPQRSERPNPEQVAKEREQRRRELEKRKLETTIRHRILAEVLKKIGLPLERCDLALIADALIERMEPLRREALARRHKAVEGSYPEVQKGLVRLLRQLDESGLSKLIVEMILLASVDTPSQPDADALLNSARQHRVDTTKLRSAVLAELASKQVKTEAKRKAPVKKATAKPRKAA